MMMEKTRWQFSWYRTTILPLCQRAASENPLRHSASPLCSKMVRLFAPWCTAMLRMVRYGWYGDMPEREHSALFCTIWCNDGMVVHTIQSAHVQSLVPFGATPGSLWIGRTAKTAPFDTI